MMSWCRVRATYLLTRVVAPFADPPVLARDCREQRLGLLPALGSPPTSLGCQGRDPSALLRGLLVPEGVEIAAAAAAAAASKQRCGRSLWFRADPAERLLVAGRLRRKRRKKRGWPSSWASLVLAPPPGHEDGCRRSSGSRRRGLAESRSRCGLSGLERGCGVQPGQWLHVRAAEKRNRAGKRTR